MEPSIIVPQNRSTILEQAKHAKAGHMGAAQSIADIVAENRLNVPVVWLGLDSILNDSPSGASFSQDSHG